MSTSRREKTRASELTGGNLPSISCMQHGKVTMKERKGKESYSEKENIRAQQKFHVVLTVERKLEKVEKN